MVEEIGIKEGDKLMLRVGGEEIILKKVHSKPKIAKAWNKVTVEEEITKHVIG